MALRFASKKCKIAVVDIERDAAKQTVNEIVKNNGTAVAYCVSRFSSSISLGYTISGPKKSQFLSFHISFRWI